MKRVYVVTSGSYSDYGIDAIFDSKELAQQFIDAFGGEFTYFNEIEEWSLNPAESELKQGRKPFCVNMNKDGDVELVYRSKDSDEFTGYAGGVSITYRRTTNTIEVYCFADDEKHAVKIANEKRTQILALNKWGQSNPLNN